MVTYLHSMVKQSGNTIDCWLTPRGWTWGLLPPMVLFGAINSFGAIQGFLALIGTRSSGRWDWSPRLAKVCVS